jgi:WD40 repeat-containing protein SMU1
MSTNNDNIGGENNDIKIESKDIVRLMLQFCKEHNLMRTFHTLQEESQISLNTVDNLKQFVNDVMNGRWDNVLKQMQNMNLAKGKLIDLYEHIVLELCEMRELDTAKLMLNNVECLKELKFLESERYLTLERLTNAREFDELLAYGERSREQRRLAIATALKDELKIIPPARLLSLIGQALKYQQKEGILSPLEFGRYDIFTGQTVSSFQTGISSTEETFPTTLAKTIKLGKKTYPLCAVFSPNGEYLVTGSIDGFVEVWDYGTGTLNKELKYQTLDRIMMHNTAVLSVCFNSTSDLLASGSQDGMIKIWNVKTGECVRQIDRAHQKGINCMVFSADSTQILSGSQDNTIRIHSLQSGYLMKSFSGHQSFVNSVLFMPDMSRIISGSSDATVKIWNVKTMECIATFYPDPVREKNSIHQAPIHSVALLPRTKDQLVICSAAPTIHITDLNGQLLKSIGSSTMNTVDFVQCVPSPQGHYIHAVDENHELHSFNVSTGNLEHSMRVHKRDVFGIIHHPYQNLIATFSNDGTVKLWT